MSDLYILKLGSQVVVGSPAQLLKHLKSREILVRSGSTKKIGYELDITIDRTVGGFMSWVAKKKKPEENFFPEYKPGIFKLKEVNKDGYIYSYTGRL